MKRSALIAAILALFLSACGEKATEAPATETAPAPAAAPAPASAPAADTTTAPATAPAMKQ